jgi:copper chaperone CopZ
MKREQAASDVAELDLAVPSMVCDGCAETIRAALKALPGVRDVKVSLWHKRVRVRFEPSRLEEARIRQVIAAAGFAEA